MTRLTSAFLITMILLTSFLLTTISYAGKWNNSRDYEFILMKGNQLPEALNQPIKKFFLFSYNASLGKWKEIPCQIDKWNEDNKWYRLPTTSDVLDPLDEMIFMAKDMGDRAIDWINDADSKQYLRHEIKSTDPNDPQKVAYVYLYRSSTWQDTTKSYMSYIPAPANSAADKITGLTYTQGHNSSGVPDFLSFPTSIGGSNTDILDRQKARLKGKALGQDVSLSENNLTKGPIEAVVGKTRIARRVNFQITISLYGGLVKITYPLPVSMYYYPYSLDYRGASGTLGSSDEVTVTHIRQSYDLSSNVATMNFKFYNNNNSNVVVDGTADAINTNLVFDPEVNWYMISGTGGCILTLGKLAQFGDMKLYYYDKSSGGTGDGTTDSGDNKSYGDVGFWVTGTELLGRFSISFINYFLGNQNPSKGPEFALNYKNQLSISITSGAVPVELASFKAFVEQGVIQLRWITVTERDNYGFEIQRSLKGESDWEKVGFVKGNGTTAISHSYSFVDNAQSTDELIYRLKQINMNGSYTLSDEVNVKLSQPDQYVLFQNYPNPFNPDTRIDYQVPANMTGVVKINLAIYNLLGAEVRNLVSIDQPAGYYSVRWDGRDNQGYLVPTGTYFYRLVAGNFVATRRLVLIK
jgi:hypothetical protein